MVTWPYNGLSVSRSESHGVDRMKTKWACRHPNLVGRWSSEFRRRRVAAMRQATMTVEWLRGSWPHPAQRDPRHSRASAAAAAGHAAIVRPRHPSCSGLLPTPHEPRSFPLFRRARVPSAAIVVWIIASAFTIPRPRYQNFSSLPPPRWQKPFMRRGWTSRL